MRMIKRAAALAAVAVAAGALAGCNKGSAKTTLRGIDDSSDIATVNGTPITKQDFYVALQGYRPQQATANEPAGMVRLRMLIDNAIIEQLAKKQNVYPSDAQIAEQLSVLRTVQEQNSVQPFDEQLRDQGLTEDDLKRFQIIPQLCQLNLLSKGITIEAPEIRAYYDRHKADMFTKPERAHIKRMVLASQSDANAVYKDLKKGVSFEQLNETHSIDKQLVGGELTQWLPLDDPRSSEAKPLFDAIRKTPAGESTPPVQYQRAWWIVQVVEKKPKEVVDFRTAEPLVHMSMMQQKIAADPARYVALEENIRNEFLSADIGVTDPRYQSLIDSLKNPPPVTASAEVAQPPATAPAVHPAVPAPSSGKAKP